MTDEPKYKLDLVLKASNDARNRMMELLATNPEIVRYGEGQIHFEFGKFFSDSLVALGCVPWKDCLLLSDIRQGIELGMPSRGWGLIDKIFRPDFTTVPNVNGWHIEGQPSVLHEIKAIVTADKRVGRLGNERVAKTTLKSQLNHFHEDDKKFNHMLSLGSGRQFTGVKYVLHYHSSFWGNVPSEFTGDGWRTLVSMYDGKLLIREFVQILKGEDGSSLLT